MPKDWKYSLAVHSHSEIILTIQSAPIDLVGLNLRKEKGLDIQINHYWLDREYDGDLLKIFEQIKNALNIDNHDNSDTMTDYFDVGHYISIYVGRWDKPFVYLRKAT